MPNYRCCVGGCNNDSRYPDKVIKRSHVTVLKYHYFPKDPEKKNLWVSEVKKGLVDFSVSNNKVVCSNHFQYGKPTYASPYPTLYMTLRSTQKGSPCKRRKLEYKKEPADEDDTLPEPHAGSSKEGIADKGVQCSEHIRSTMIFSDLTRDVDVNFFTGLQDAATFKIIFDYLSKKGAYMHYWKGLKNTFKDLSSPRNLNNVSLRSMTLEQEFLMVMMRLRLALLNNDLANRFIVSTSVVSSVFTTWIKLIASEMKWLIHWPDRNVIRRNLPSMFRKYYPNCCIIIDCSELFIETPSALDIAATCWSNYKHHSTVKYLVGITPNGAISFLSDCYGGRATDVYIVNDCGFLRQLQPNDQVMADRGFKIRDTLAFYQCTLAIPPSKHTNLQMTKKDVNKTSKIANVRIYVEQAIGRMKNFRIIKNELPVSLLPMVDNIVTVCSIMTNFMTPLCEDDKI